MTISYVVIDGETFNVPVLSIERDANFLDKFAERTNDGKLHRELIGVFISYKLKFGKASMTDYAALWEKLTEPVEFHTVIVPDEDGNFVFSAYFSNIKDRLYKLKEEQRFWRDLTVNFIAKEPARTPA